MKKALLLLAALACSGAVAQSISTPTGVSSVNLACLQGDDSDYARGFCVGVIEAVYSMMDGWCVPNNVTHGQVQALVRAGLPSKMRSDPLMPASDAIIELIQEAWPCQ
jgi:hypothetical protein